MVSILGANSVSGGYEVSNSLRFNDDDSAYLSKTPSASNRTTMTFSVWVKRASLGQHVILGAGSDRAFLDFDNVVLLEFQSFLVKWFCLDSNKSTLQ